MTDAEQRLREKQYTFRHGAVEMLRADLIGPRDGEDEIIGDAPATHYATGILFPRGEDPISDPLDLDEPDDGEEGSAPDPGVARAAGRQPSSCGLTFAVHTSAARLLRIACSAARYVPVDEEGTEVNDFDRRDFEYLSGDWRRRPIDDFETVVSLETLGDQIHEVVGGLELFIRVREPDSRGIAAVTTVLLNKQVLPPGEMRDPAAFFQARIRVTEVDGADVFAERRFGTSLVDDAELRSYDLLYRHARSFAVGHGCAASWETSERDDRAAWVETDFIPAAPVNVADSNDQIVSDALSMRFCAEASSPQLIVGLEALALGYERWIEEIAETGAELDDRYREAVGRHVSECRGASARLRGGIQHLQDDPDSMRAFRLANQAMLIQRARTDWNRDGRPGSGPSSDQDGRWRPFQLAFILLCIRGIAMPEDPERELVDLLWFPTGGGKTEAYLGLIAFTIFRRRITQNDGSGVTVIMRYTLRLLTTQQFARASLLICCCEWLRQQTSGLGDAPISIGLWVGRGGTPNTRANANTALRQITATGSSQEGDPRQLQSCPWCGTPLRVDHYWMGDHPPRLAITCRHKGCDFSAGLPVYLIDEDIYAYRPSLIIATSDKFASMPWNPDIGALFGLTDSDASPPELIVQDELHLISGPLGTLAGLYETAVDYLSTRESVRPKVIASTATIRRASQQVAALFDRLMAQFPPPGIDSRDSYFAVEAKPDDRGNRLYVGVMAPGTSQTSAMVRTYGSLLASSELSQEPDAVKDPYWTLLGYFNSLRVLGGARMQVQDDVVDRLKLTLGRETRRSMEPIEMTSRISSGEIPEALSRMESSLGKGHDEEVLDVVLATNMISVGVDIDRLGLMVVMGQPQATAEYIQATSRVGRRHPGLVVIVFNSARSRDRSHYESFQSFHSALYRQVESTSVTPFASRARDRGLHAIFIALCRMTVPGLRDNKAASQIGGYRSEVEKVKEVILDRVDRVDVLQRQATSDELDRLVMHWIARAEHVGKLSYADIHNPHMALLADPAGSNDPGALPTLYSLRDVDPESTLQIV
jgi:hypothetical protein